MSNSKILTKEVAEQFLKQADSIDLSKFTSIEDSAAQVLAEHKGSLLLTRLTHLSDVAASALARHKGTLWLQGVSQLSDAGVESLVQHDGDVILLNLVRFTDHAARLLSAKMNKSIMLGESGQKLVRRIRVVIDTDVVRQFIAQEHIDLSDCQVLNDDAAQLLSNHRGSLNLDGINQISIAAAESLGKHEGRLSIQGLNDLSDECICLLSKHNGPIAFSKSIKKLSDFAAAALAHHRGSLFLQHVKNLSDVAAGHLARHEGEVVTGITALYDSPGHLAFIRSMISYSRSLWLDSVTKIADAAAAELAACKGDLYLRGLTSLSEAAAEVFAKSEGEIHISDKLQKVLEKKRQSYVLFKDQVVSAIISNNLSLVKRFGTIDDRARRILNQLEIDGEIHSGRRPLISSQILLNNQIFTSESERPKNIIIQSQKNLNKFSNSVLNKVGVEQESARGVVADILENKIINYSCQSDLKCQSYHFKMPLTVKQKVDSIRESNLDFKKSSVLILTWLKEALGAIDAEYVDVENLTENCEALLDFTKRCFKNRYVSHISLKESQFQIRTIGSEIGIIYAYFSKKVCSCKWSCPQHEISDLINRSLPDDKTMIYLDDESNGLYVLLETAGMEERLEFLYA